MESGAGDPWIPTGWINQGLDAGDSAQGATVHSGASSLQFNTGASAEGIYFNDAVSTAGKFINYGFFVYINGGSVRIASLSDFMLRQVGGGIIQDYSTILTWGLLGLVARAENVRLRPYPIALSGATDTRFIDDIYGIEMDDVSLTITPASEANSTEDGGLRVDGLDTLTQPIPAGSLGATSGKVRFDWTPRHGAGDFEKFGNAANRICNVYKDAANEFFIFTSGNTDLRLTIDVAGVTRNGSIIDMTGIIAADTKYLVEIEYNATEITWSIDGIAQSTDTPPAGIDFGANIPDIFYGGSRYTGLNQSDGVFSNP